jgi:hypothetical protein
VLKDGVAKVKISKSDATVLKAARPTTRGWLQEWKAAEPVSQCPSQMRRKSGIQNATVRRAAVAAFKKKYMKERYF